MTNPIDRQQPRSDTTRSPRVEVTGSQLLEPVTVGASPDCCHCTSCRTCLREGEQIGLYAYRLRSADRWDVTRVFCHTCAPEQVREPTLGVAEILVTGTLSTLSESATQLHRLCVTEVRTQRVSPPTEGVQP